MPNVKPTKAQSLFSLLALSALGCATTDSHAANVESLKPTTTPPANSQVAVSATQREAKLSAVELRAQGPEGLAIALAAFDQLEEGAQKDAQALIVDQVAAQRYASVSRLFWYTDIETAKSSSASSGKPILSLRLLGRLDEDYSCANSRLFRTVLYANKTVSSYLRDNFTLHWSSEREVPKVTIDFGNGRTLKTTMGGNSAHYILDSEGRPIDIIPGLYGPKAFVEALEPAKQLAISAAKLKDPSAQILAYHRKRAGKDAARFGKLSAQQRAALKPYRDRRLSRELFAAEMMTVSKAVIEVPLVRLAALGATPIAAPDSMLVLASVSAVDSLDTSSKSLIASIGPTDWQSIPQKLNTRRMGNMLAELERRAAADTLINEYGLRPMISKLFLQQGGRDFASLNATLYAEVFITPKSDAWLGLARPMVFTGLPADGLRKNK